MFNPKMQYPESIYKLRKIDRDPPNI
jgi:hypothetical protein